jgi:hypothetical protein
MTPARRLASVQCANCGYESASQTRFCARCGRPLDAPTPEPQPQAAPPPPAPPTAPTPWGAPAPAPPASYAPPGPPPGYGQPLPQPPQQPYPGYGYPYGYGYPAPSYGPSTNGLAVASLVLGIVGFLLCFIGPAVAIVLGVIGRNQIRASGGREQGEGLAKAGIILGAIFLALWVTYFVTIIIVSAARS